MIREIAEEERFQIDEAGFSESLEAQREQSRKATAEVQNRLSALREVLRGHADLTATQFEGYERTEMIDTPAEVVRLATWREGAPVRVSILQKGQVGVVILDQTVFYAESGGEVGDTGELLWDGGRARVVDTQKDQSGIFFHFVEVEEGSLARHTKVQLKVDHDRRLSIQRNHTATHLLHAALRLVLGKSVRQAGSLVAPDRLRFDFTYHRGMFRQEWEQTEDMVNEWIRRSVQTEFVWRSYQEAIAAGAMALFGEKYGERVRTVNVPGFSLELCGGCHVRNTGEIGLFLIDSERGVASGVRRIEAVTGTYSLDEVRRQRTTYGELVARLGIRSGDYDQQLQKADQLRQRQSELESEMRKLRMQLVSGSVAPGGRRGAAGGRHPRAHPRGAAGTGQRAARHGRRPALQDRLGRGGDRHPRRGQRQPGRLGEQGPDRPRQGRRPGQEALRDRGRRRRRPPRLRPGRRQGPGEAAGGPGRRRGGGARAVGAVGPGSILSDSLGGSVEALITPALFSRPPPFLTGEEGVVSRKTEWLLRLL